MKKVILGIVLFALTFSVLIGCSAPAVTPRNPNVLYDDPLSNEQKAQISDALSAQRVGYVDWNRIDPCLGTINDCVILINRNVSVACVVWGEEIADCVFEWGNPAALYAYRDGEACYLREAYEKGWLTKAHIRLVHAKHEEIRENWGQITTDWINSQKEAHENSRDPDVLYREPLSDEQKESIRSSMWGLCKKMVRWGYVDPYYGTINDCAVVIIHPFGTPKEEPWSQEIAGYTFEWDSPIELYVDYEEPYSLGATCSLWEAYQKGLLTEAQIGVIYERHEQYRLEFPHMLEEWEQSRETETES